MTKGPPPGKIPATGDKNILSPKEAFKKALSQSQNADESALPAEKNKNLAAEEVTHGASIIEFVDNVIENAISLGASDIHVEPYQESARLRVRCDGALQEVQEFGKFLFENYSAITTRIKILSSLDISERRLPQDGALRFSHNNEEVDLRVSVLPTLFGERIVMRVMDKKSLQTPLDHLGFTEDSYKKLIKAINSPQGMILVTGPTGSGKSTTLYAVLNALNKSDLNILTAEDPVEFGIVGIGQVHVRETIGLSFSASLRSFLRQDPEIVMVGEIRDVDTGEIAVKASLTGHLVLSTLHTNDAPGTITRLINMGIPNYLITSSLTLVIAQRLARKICESCKIEDTDQIRERLMSIGFPENEAGNTKVLKGKGCDKCFNSGYKGRRAIHEVLVITSTIKEAILKGATNFELRKVAQEKDNFKTMQDTGRNLLIQGIISIDEYQRVLMVED